MILRYIFPMKNLSLYSESRDNNLNLIRFLAAFAVVVNHSVSIVHGETIPEPLVVATGYSLGNLAVNVFFVVSGFLIAQSFLRSRDIYEYLSARILRLLPALIVVAVLTAFVIGPIVTGVSLREYFGDMATWTYVPLIASLFAETTIPLKGVFDTLPSESILNIPLWTLRWEFLAYLGIAVLGVMGILSSKKMFGLCFVSFVAMFIVITAFTDLRSSWDPIDHMFRLGFSFILGSAFFVYRSHIPVLFVPVVVIWALTYLFRDSVLYQLLLIAALGYTTFWLAYVPGGIVRLYNKLPDVSYGVYIYGFILSQVIIQYLPGLSSLELLLVSIPVIIPAAALSYYLVEAPYMKKRKVFAGFMRNLFVSRTNAREGQLDEGVKPTS